MKGTVLLILLILGCGIVFWTFIDIVLYLVRHKYKRFFLEKIYTLEAIHNLQHKYNIFKAEWSLKFLQIESEKERIKKKEEEAKKLAPVEEVAVIPGGFTKIQWLVQNSQGNNNNYITIEISPDNLPDK